MNEQTEKELIKIRDKVDRMICSERTVEEIQELLSIAIRIAERMDFVGRENLCLRHLTKTRNDELKALLNVINKPRKRISKFEDLRKSFLTDLKFECLAREQFHQIREETNQ